MLESATVDIDFEEASNNYYFSQHAIAHQRNILEIQKPLEVLT
jgi:hypothetical protein